MIGPTMAARVVDQTLYSIGRGKLHVFDIEQAAEVPVDVEPFDFGRPRVHGRGLQRRDEFRHAGLELIAAQPGQRIERDHHSPALPQVGAQRDDLLVQEW